VALEAQGPIDELARQVWRALPARVRAEKSVATWAFGNGNRFDLLAVPRLSAVVLDGSYRRVEELSTEEEPAVRPRRPARFWLFVGAIALLAGVGAGIGLAWRREGAEPEPEPVAPAVPREVKAAADEVPRSPTAREKEALEPGEARRLNEAFVALAERFGMAPEGEPAALVEKMARALRYQGPWLSERERRALTNVRARDAAQAIAWDDRIRRFANDRPLPPGFANGPARWQAWVLAWSFHSESDLRSHSPAEEVQALGEALAVEFSLRPLMLEAEYPALRSYRAFLERLPRR
jgi:hypothetical protein